MVLLIGIVIKLVDNVNAAKDSLVNVAINVKLDILKRMYAVHVNAIKVLLMIFAIKKMVLAHVNQTLLALNVMNVHQDIITIRFAYVIDKLFICLNY